MFHPDKEPSIAVGLVEDVPAVSFDLRGEFMMNKTVLTSGAYEACAGRETIFLRSSKGREICASPALRLFPATPQATFTMHQVMIGKKFHWERVCSQKFSGELAIRLYQHGRLTAINNIFLEDYLVSVIASEMSPDSPMEFLKAHCICSRSWLLHQLTVASVGDQTGPKADYRNREVMCWTGREAHCHFDVCADDHCQRYQGIGHINEAAHRAVSETRGEVLIHNGVVCNARYAKCCGGITELFSTAWDNINVPYLQSTPDSWELLPFILTEREADQFIRSRPAAYCNIEDRALIRRILPSFDAETRDFFRWQVVFSQDELWHILHLKTGIDFGAITGIVPLCRGPSGRLFKVKICGTREERVIGKELEIRRLLSPTHLLSSAFVVEPGAKDGDIPRSFTLYGAGWGHGVGLCQIGAASMAERGMSYQEILFHYFRGAQLKKLY